MSMLLFLQFLRQWTRLYGLYQPIPNIEPPFGGVYEALVLIRQGGRLRTITAAQQCIALFAQRDLFTVSAVDEGVNVIARRVKVSERKDVHGFRQVERGIVSW